MDFLTQRNTFQKIILFLVFIVCGFSSCTQNVPEIYPANGKIIFEWESEESFPDARLSVFVESIGDPRRFESIILKSESGFEWETEDIAKIQRGEKKYAGYTNFIMPEGEKLPKGKYFVTYVNADEEQVETQFNLDYNLEYYTLSAKEAADFMKSNRGINKIAVFDKNNTLLFYGNKYPDFMTTRDIWNQYAKADYFYNIWVSSNNTLICIMPSELVQPNKVE